MRVPILLYHWFDEPLSRSRRSPEFGMRPDDFRRHMDWLKDAGRSVVGLDRVVAALREAAPLPQAPVVITFDDGYDDFRDHALPVLAERGFQAVMFAVAGLVGRTNQWDQALGEPPRRLLDWDGLRELARNGVEIGAHSVTHPDLRTLDDARLAAECRDSKLRLEDGLGAPVRYLAYPFGRFDRRVKRAARAAGYEAAAAVLLRPWDLLRSDDFALMRVIIHATKGLASLRLRTRLAAADHRVAA